MMEGSHDAEVQDCKEVRKGVKDVYVAYLGIVSMQTSREVLRVSLTSSSTPSPSPHSAPCPSCTSNAGSAVCASDGVSAVRRLHEQSRAQAGRRDSDRSTSSRSTAALRR
jgi:hypothetical protein